MVSKAGISSASTTSFRLAVSRWKSPQRQDRSSTWGAAVITRCWKSLSALQEFWVKKGSIRKSRSGTGEATFAIVLRTLQKHSMNWDTNREFRWKKDWPTSLHGSRGRQHMTALRRHRPNFQNGGCRYELHFYK